jgi:hypothetical protein
MRKLSKLSKLAAALAVLSALASSNVFAESASDTVDAKVGIQPAMELICTDVSFGVWRIPARTGAATTITLDRDTGAVTATGNTTRVAQSTSNASWLHERGTCTLSGSTAANGAAVAITMTGSTAMSFDAANATTTGFVGLNAPTTSVSGMQATLNAATSVNLSTGGTATFYVGGVLTIPGTIVSGNYGGYKTTTPATVTANDGV